MTELEKLCEQALYEEIKDLGDGKSIVRDVPTGRLFFRKVLTVYNMQVFAYLKDHKSRYVPRVESFREEEDTLIVIEEFVQGRTLADLLNDESISLPFQERIRILTEVCDGLSYLHGADPPIIHRDLKASNVMLTEDGVVKIIDYDAAKIYVSGEKKDTVLMGTHGVAAPEQYGFAASDVRTDIYALGKLIERMLPENIDAARIVVRATHIDPKKRYSSAAQVREQIIRIREHGSSLDTRMEKTVPGFDPRKKSHRILGRAAVFFLCAAILSGAALAVWFVGVRPGMRREAFRMEMEKAESGGTEKGDVADDIERFLVQFPYEKMSEEDQRRFRNSVEKRLSGYSSTNSITYSIFSVLTERCRDEEAVEAIRQYTETERLLNKESFEEAFEKLSRLKEAGTMDIEEKWADAVQRCLEKAISLEELYNQGGSEDHLKKALELYELIISNCEESRSEEARDAHDRLFRTVLDRADTDSESGEFDAAEKTYILLQEYQNTEQTAQIDLEERISANTYRKAQSLFEEENYAEAYEIFLQLKEYSDAPVRAAQCQYLIAGQHMEKQDYRKAIKAYELCPGYEDADTKLLEAKYRHCDSVSGKPDDDAYIWIEDLLSAGYPGAEAVRDTIYQWHTEIENGMGMLVGSQQASHMRVKLYGGQPEASTHIRIDITDNVTGEQISWKSSETCSRGGQVDANYYVDTLDYSIFEREYTLNVYSDDGKKIGTWTGVPSMEFLKD
ncbi:MAG: serine/threonine-protein kinase [Eubacteriales bacterium]|nr:serine/threonine-protein kinase [Eubacteriales bacterium]